MIKKPITLTIVIPVYNEERYIKACLESIKNQSEAPSEVIVVDNNSTDKTVEIAEQFSFVRVFHEQHQHQVFAQAKGFNEAKGDILGRIDADTILPPDWVTKVKSAFADQKVIGVTGNAAPYDIKFKLVGRILFESYLFMVFLIAGHRMLWGANCAIRKDGWQKVKNQVLMRGDIWEDYDMSFCLARYGDIKYLPDLKIGASFRAVQHGLITHFRYQFRAVRTFFYRVSKIKLFLFITFWTSELFLALIVYPFSLLDALLSKKTD